MSSASREASGIGPAAGSIVVDLRGGELTVVVGCRGAARELARLIGFDVVDQTRIATAVSEIVRNAVQYALTATLILRQLELSGRRGIEVLVEDRGPGIADLERVLQGGYSTSGGLGRGIAGARKLMDEFEIESFPSRGTRVRMCKWLAVEGLAGAEQHGARKDAVGSADWDAQMRAGCGADGGSGVF